MIPTFTPASLLYPCEHRNGSTCHRVDTPMQVAWLAYEAPPESGLWRLSGYHLCPKHAAEWARDGVPAFALEWRRDYRGEARLLLGAEPLPLPLPVALVESVLPQVAAPRGSELFANV